MVAVYAHVGAFDSCRATSLMYVFTHNINDLNLSLYVYMYETTVYTCTPSVLPPQSVLGDLNSGRAFDTGCQCVLQDATTCPVLLTPPRCSCAVSKSSAYIHVYTCTCTLYALHLVCFKALLHVKVEQLLSTQILQQNSTCTDGHGENTVELI